MGLILDAFFPPIMSVLGILLVRNIYLMNECFNRIDDNLTECIELCESMRATLRTMR